jgi:hypothetical protein
LNVTGQGARHPVDKPHDGLHSQAKDQFKKNDIRFHILRDKNGQATLRVGDTTSNDDVIPEGRKERKIKTMRRKLMESRKTKDKQENRKVRVMTTRIAKTYKDQKIVDASDVPSNNLIQSEELVVVGSDVVSLYPSLTDIEVAVICYNAIMESNISFGSINYRQARMYLAMHMTEAEQRISPLRRVLPTREASGVRPGVTSDPRKEGNWIFPDTELTELEQRMVIAMMVQIGVIVAMNTHQYSFDGKMFLQNAGGPIGLRVTCAIARVVMNTWDRKWIEQAGAELCQAQNQLG